MKNFSRFLLWTLVFALLLLGIDQLLLHMRLDLPVYRETRSFYLDLRGRLLGTGPSRPRSVEEVIESTDEPPATHPRPQGTRETTPSDTGPGYLYVDREGNLNFADTLADVPARYRSEAQKMTR